MAILMSAIKSDATQEDIESFPQRFQKMVQTVFENADEVIEISYSLSVVQSLKKPCKIKTI